MPKTSVVFVIGQLGLGGSEKQLYLLARELILREWHVTVINLNPGVADHWAQPLAQLGVRLFSPPQTQNQIERVVAISKILRSEKPLIVHSWSLYTNIFAALCGYLAQVPVRLGSERGNQAYSRRSYGNWRYALSMIGLDAVVTNSKLEAELLKKTKPGLNVGVLANGIDLDGLHSRTKARELLRIPEDNIVLGGIGSLTPNKNFRYLIEATAKIISKHPKLKLALIGDGPERDNLLKTASELMPFDQIKFLGAVPEAYKLLKGIDILCVSSLSEGMPNVVLEACGAGVPVVANRVGAIPSIIKDGVHGFVVEVANESEFTSAIEKLICNKNLREEMGASGRKLVLDEYSSKTMANNFVLFYRGLIGS